MAQRAATARAQAIRDKTPIRDTQRSTCRLAASRDTTAAHKRIAKMIGRIRHIKQVEVGSLLSDWQVQDMHRKRPGTKRIRSRGVAATIIRPHSRYEMQRGERFAQREMRRAKAAQRRHANFMLPRTYPRYRPAPGIPAPRTAPTLTGPACASPFCQRALKEGGVRPALSSGALHRSAAPG